MSVKYPEFEAEIYDSFTVDDAMAFLGAEAVEKGEYHLKIGKGKDAKKLRFKNCLKAGGGKLSGNRPFRPALAKRYMNEILRGEWQGKNGETFSFDSHGKVVSAQHRMAALIMAEEVRKQNPGWWKEHYGWKGPITIEALVVTGVEPEAADTTDLGQKRSAGDVLFRRHEFGGNVSERDSKKLSRILGEAIRLVWLRSGGKIVSDAPHFPHSAMLDEVEKHPELKESIKYIMNEEVKSATGEEDRKAMRISQYISLSYAAALHYLFATSSTSWEAWKESAYDSDSIDFTSQEQADEFFAKLGMISQVTMDGIDKEKDAAIIELHKEIQKRKGSDSQLSRDAKYAMFVKAWQNWTGQEDHSKIALTKNELKDLGSIRIGGLDVIPPEPEEEEEVEAEDKPTKKPKKPRNPKAAPKKPKKNPKAASQEEEQAEEEEEKTEEAEAEELVGAEA